MNKSGITHYLEIASDYLFKRGITGVSLSEKIEVIHQDLEDRFDKNKSIDVIIEQFGGVETVVKEYDLLPQGSNIIRYKTYLRWISFILILFIPSIFFVSMLSFFQYSYSDQLMIVKVLAGLRSNLFFLLTFAYFWYNSRLHDWVLQRMSPYDPRYRKLKTLAAWKYILPLFFLWSIILGFGFISFSTWQKLASPVQHYLSVGIKLLITSFVIYYLNTNNEKIDNSIEKKNLISHIIFFAIVLPSITSIALYNNLEFELFEIITDQKTVGNTGYQSSVIIGLSLILNIIWFLIPVILALITLNHVRTGQTNYQIPWLLGNLYFVCVLIINQYGYTFRNRSVYSSYGEFGGDEYLGYLSYGIPVKFVIFAFVFWNSIFGILHYIQESSSLVGKLQRKHYSIERVRHNKIQVILLMLFIVVLIASPFANYKAEMQFSAGIYQNSELDEEENTEEYPIRHLSNEYPIVQIPQHGQVDIIFVIPRYSDFSFNLSWMNKDRSIQINEQQFQQHTVDNHLVYTTSFEIDQKTEILMEYDLGILPENPDDLELALETYIYWSSNYVINGWFTIWTGIMQLAVLLIYARRDMR